jgi:hypothetical protein
MIRQDLRMHLPLKAAYTRLKSVQQWTIGNAAESGCDSHTSLVAPQESDLPRLTAAQQ